MQQHDRAAVAAESGRLAQELQLRQKPSEVPARARGRNALLRRQSRVQGQFCERGRRRIRRQSFLLAVARVRHVTAAAVKRSNATAALRSPFCIASPSEHTYGVVVVLLEKYELSARNGSYRNRNQLNRHRRLLSNLHLIRRVRSPVRVRGPSGRVYIAGNALKQRSEQSRKLNKRTCRDWIRVTISRAQLRPRSLGVQIKGHAHTQQRLCGPSWRLVDSACDAQRKRLNTEHANTVSGNPMRKAANDEDE